MENKDTNTDYQKVVGVGDQIWEILETAIEIFFFFLRFLFTILYIGSFEVPPEKKSCPSRSTKVPIPTQKPNLT